jgi:hypothetical protein
LSSTYHCVNTTAVASLDEQLHIGIHEWRGHGDVGAVGKNKVGVLAELFDEGEDVIPAAAVETGAVITQFIDNLRMSVKVALEHYSRGGPTSSISKAAVIVSIRTVARMVPRGMPM